MFVKLTEAFGDRRAGDVINVPATLARSLIFHGKAEGGRINANEAKPVNLARPPSRAIQAGPQPEPKPEKQTIYPRAYKPLDGTVKEMKAWLDKHGVEYNARALKTELQELIKRQ